MLIQPLNMDSSDTPRPSSPSYFERRHDFTNGTHRTPTPRGRLPEGEEGQTVQARDSEHRTDDSPAVPRARKAAPQETKSTRVGLHEMPVSS